MSETRHKILKGFTSRILDEVARLDCHKSFAVVPDPMGHERGYNRQRRYASWIGGSIVSSLSVFKQVSPYPPVLPVII